MKNILFICSANKDRSKTAEDYFSEKYPQLNFDSAGSNKKICNQLGTNYIEEEQLLWADEIFVMENHHYKTVKELFGNQFLNKITVLNIKDHYKYGSKDLIGILESKIDFFIK